MPSLRPVLHEILEAIAVGSDLQEVARMLCLQAEALVEGSVCSLVTVDREGFLHPLAAPSMPEAAFAAIGSLLIGPAAGSCGTAAFRGEEVVVEEITTDPVWRDHRAVVLPLGLKASWSIPIKAEDGRVVASLGLYRNRAGAPPQAAREIVATCIHLFQIAFRQQETQARIERLAYRDMLTNLPNRLSFELRAAEALAEPGNTSVCIHYLDLHDFKTVNDTVGHWVGDLLLAEVGRRLESVGGGKMFVSRLGGDEFAVLSRAPTDAQQEKIADALLAVFGAPFDVAGYHLRIGASIGSAIATRTDDDLQQLLRNADLARHEAKSFGHARRLFSEEMAETFHRRAFLKAELSAALDRGQFRVEYQPIVDLEKGSVASFEALVRWHHPDLGRVPPDHFIPVAEEMGLISEIGLFVLRQALTDAAHWPPNVAVAVNVSPLQLKGPNFPLHVAAALGAAGVASCRLILEVTETALFDRDAVTWQCIDDLVALGCSIALDDFGTGYSSLSHLRDRRFSKIKIDKSFVGGLGTDTDCEAIVEGTLHFARRQGKLTTAEGIETPLQMAWLVRQGCENGQGYLFSRPMPAAQADAYLATAEQTIAHARAGADVSASALPDWSTPKKRASQ